MEFACTGQVYFPVIMAIMAKGFTPKAFMLLIIYNVCFILPLLLVTAVALRGAGIKSLSDWARTHVFGTKIAMSAIFAIIAMAMLLVVVFYE